MISITKILSGAFCFVVLISCETSRSERDIQTGAVPGHQAAKLFSEFCIQDKSPNNQDYAVLSASTNANGEFTPTQYAPDLDLSVKKFDDRCSMVFSSFSGSSAVESAFDSLSARGFKGIALREAGSNPFTGAPMYHAVLFK